MKRVFKKSELVGVVGWRRRTEHHEVCIPALSWWVLHRDILHDEICDMTDELCRKEKWLMIQGQPLIDAIKALGYEVVDDFAVKADHVPDIGKMIERIADLERQLAEANTRLFNQSEIQRYAANNAAQPDPYAHLPHGGWWVATEERLFWWPNDKDQGQRFTIAGEPHDPDGDGNWCNVWKYSAHVRTPTITRAQAIAIIEQHKAEQKPEAAFGGPDDEKAVAWAKERGHRVVAYRPTRTGDRFIPFSYAKSKEPWGNCVSFSKDDSGEAVYILTPEASKVYTCEPAGAPDSQTTLVNLAWACEHNEHDRDGTKLANAIDAHMRAVALSLYTKGQADAVNNT